MKQVIVILSLVLMLVACEPTVKQGMLDTPVRLKVGQSLDVDGMLITVEKISEDSRCPQGAQCIWAGKVSVALHVQTQDSAFDMVLMLGLNDAGATQLVGVDSLTLKEVSPAPVLDQKISQSDYSVILLVRKA